MITRNPADEGKANVKCRDELRDDRFPQPGIDDYATAAAVDHQMYIPLT